MKIISMIFIFLLTTPFISFAGNVEVGNDDKVTRSKEVAKHQDKTSHENSNDDDDYPPEGTNESDD